MKKKFIFLLTITILLGFVVSCNDTSILSSIQNNSTYIEVKSLDNGEVLTKSKEITFSIVYPETTDQNEHNSLNIILENLTTGDKKESSIDSPTLNQDIQLDLGSLESGEYLLTIQFLTNGEVKTETKTTFFYVTGDYKIEGIQSFPPIIFPNTEITLSADLNIPENSNPFIRWSEDGKIIQKGYLNEGLASIKLKAPEKPGVYSVKLELFPFGPIGDNDFSFSSSITSNSEIYVSPEQPVNAYYSVIFFTNPPFDYGVAPKNNIQTTSIAQNKENTDYSQNTLASKIQLIGNPKEIKLEGTEGYTLQNGDGFNFNYSLLPVDLSGKIAPFTLSLEILFDNLSEKENILTLVNQKGDVLFRIGTDAKGQLNASFLNDKSETVNIPSGLEEIPIGKKLNLTLSFLPQNGDVKTLWFLNGYQTAKGEYSDTPISISTSAQLETIIGGNLGFKGSIFSVKVYYKDTNNNETINPDILRDFLDSEYGDKLIFCDGFDGEKITDAERTGGANFSNAYVDPGYLVIEQTGEYKTPYFEIPEGTTKLTIGYPENNSSHESNSNENDSKTSVITGKITIMAKDPTASESAITLFTIDKNTLVLPSDIIEANNLTDTDIIDQFKPLNHNRVTLELVKEKSSEREKSYTLRLQLGENKSILLSDNFQEKEQLQLQIENTSKEQIAIDYITIIKTD